MYRTTAGNLAVGGVAFQQVCERPRVGDVIDGNYVQVAAFEAAAARCADWFLAAECTTTTGQCA
jgi:hypothetical protein